MFAKGGKTKGADIIKGIQKILGVDDNQMAELWQVGINKYGSEEGIAQALNEATKGLTPQSSPDEVKAAVATVFSTGSEMFKCGGKLQKLAKRFAKGSSIDCGCNGTKLKQNGGLLNNRFYNLPDRVYNEKGVFSGYINGPEDVTYIQSRKEPRDWMVQSPTPQARLNNTTNQSRMLWNPEKLPEPYYTAYVITENPEGKGTVAHIPMNQDGGEVTEAANGVRLTRRQARDLSKQNKGYSNSQYATAYANAIDTLRRNSDLRGRDLRNQARIMASGINVGDNTQTITDTSIPQIAIAVAPAGQLNEVKTRDQALNDLVSSVIRGNYGNGDQRREALGTYYDETQAEVAKRVKNTQKKPATVTNSIASQRTPVIASSIERSTTYNEGPVFGGQSRKVQVLPSNEQVVISEYVPAQTRVSQSNASNERNRRMGRVEAYQRMTGADEALAEWGQQPYQNVDRNSEEYRQGQRDARREAAITTGAGIASAVAIPAAINAAATYIPQGIQYIRLANDLNRTRRAAQAARGTGQMLMRNAGSTATRYTPNEIFRILEASRLTPLPGSLQKGGIVKGQSGETLTPPTVFSNLGYARKSEQFKKGLPVSEVSQDRGGGGWITDYGKLMTDENGLSYRDIRESNWNSANNELNQNFYREYIPNNKYKRLVKKGWQPSDYSQEQKDSLTTNFNQTFGNLGNVVKDKFGYDVWEPNDSTLERYYPHFKNN